MGRAGVTPAQLKMIWGLARKLDIDEDTLRTRAQRYSGELSLRALSAQQAAMLIDSLQGKREPSPYRASPGQAAVIRSLAERLGWDDPNRLRGWLLSRYGVERLEWLPHDQAILCIEAMKAMLKGGRGERKRREAPAESPV
jgi:hypothetical protein